LEDHLSLHNFADHWFSIAVIFVVCIEIADGPTEYIEVHPYHRII